MSTATKPPVIGGVPEHHSLPWYRLVEAGAGLVWRDVAGGTGAMAAMLDAGELDGAVMLTEGAVRWIAAGGRGRLAGLCSATSLHWGAHVAAGSRFAELDDLAGARFAISRAGSGSHLMACWLAHEKGWPAPELVVVGDFAGGRAALAEGRADVFLWERTMCQPVVDAGEWRCVGDVVPPWPAFVLVVRDDHNGARWPASLLEAAQGEATALLADAAETARAIHARFGIAEPHAREWLEHNRWNFDPRVDPALLAQAAAALEAAGVAAPAPAGGWEAAIADTGP